MDAQLERGGSRFRGNDCATGKDHSGFRIRNVMGPGQPLGRGPASPSPRESGNLFLNGCVIGNNRPPNGQATSRNRNSIATNY
ncbi:MAG: hypothetical protein QNK22_10275 [Xanthomonadales bacterium]|nr:hypothetical protein [Xanthomonadales bacterium]